MNYSFVKSPLFKKYFMTYFLLFGLVFLLFSLYLYNVTIRELKIETEETNKAHLAQAEIMITDQFKGIARIADRMGMDKELVPYKVQDDRYTNRTMNEIKKYKESHTWINEIYLYYGEELLYSSEGTLYLERLASYSSYFENLTKEDLFEELKSSAPKIESVQFNGKGTGIEDNAFIYFLPLKVGASSQHGKILFVLDNQEAIQILDTIPNANSLILQTNYTPLFYSSSLKDQPFDQWQKFLENSQMEESGEVKVEETDYHYSSIVSDYFGWQYVSFVQTNLLYAAIHNAYWSFFSFLLMLAVIGLSLSVLFSLYHYRVFHKLYDFIRDRSDYETKPLKGIDELEELNTLIFDILSENKNLQDTLITNKTYIRNNVFVQLLEGNIDTERMNHILKNNRLQLNYQSYVICSSKITNESQDEKYAENVGKLLTRYSDFKYEEFFVNTVLLDSKNQVVFIVGSNLPISETELEEKIRELLIYLQKDIEECCEFIVSFGVGAVYSEIRKIKHSYIESIAAFDSTSQPSDTIRFFNQITSSKQYDFHSTPKQLILVLEKSLKEGEQEVAKEVLQSIRAYFNQHELSDVERKFITFELIQTIVYAAIENDIHRIKGDLERMMNFDTIHPLLDTLTEYVTEISHLQFEAKHSLQENVAEGMIRYIEGNYLSSALSLEDIATRFNFSVSYTSRIIKEHIGISFNQYVQNLRLEEFKIKLIQTDLPIKELVLEVGYLDVSNFTRKFKAQLGITPSEYRKRHKQSSI